MGYLIPENCKLAHKIAFCCRRLNTRILVEHETTVTPRKMCGLKELMQRKNKMSKELDITEYLGLPGKISGKHFNSKMESTVFQVGPKPLAVPLCITHHSHY